MASFLFPASFSIPLPPSYPPPSFSPDPRRRGRKEGGGEGGSPAYRFQKRWATFHGESRTLFQPFRRNLRCKLTFCASRKRALFAPHVLGCPFRTWANAYRVRRTFENAAERSPTRSLERGKQAEFRFGGSVMVVVNSGSKGPVS